MVIMLLYTSVINHCKFKYLGVNLDPSLTWNDHIDYIASKISSRLGNLNCADNYMSLK